MSSYALQAEEEMWAGVVASDPTVHATYAPARSSSRKSSRRRSRRPHYDGPVGDPRPRSEFAEHYSERNCLVLEAAGAELVAGYREWQAAGRQVRKGEHGIAIEAPVTVKDRETGETKMVGVKTAYVFDVSQTDEIAR